MTMLVWSRAVHKAIRVLRKPGHSAAPLAEATATAPALPDFARASEPNSDADALPRIALRWTLRLLPIAALLGVLGGLRWPQAYTDATWMIDYHFGFGKRGLIGTVLHVIDHPPFHYATLAWMMFAIFVLWMGALLAIALSPVRRDLGIAVALLLFLLSPGFASLVRDVGRGEHFGLLIIIPTLAMPLTAPFLALRAALAVLAVLIHEGNMLMALPVMAFDVMAGSVRRPILAAVVVMLPAFLLTSFMASSVTACDTAHALAYYGAQAADFSIPDLPITILCFDINRNISYAQFLVWSLNTGPGHFVILGLALAVVVPGVAFNLWGAARIMTRRPALILAAGAATCAPFALLVAAIDVQRFVLLLAPTSLLVLLAAARRLGVPAEATLKPTPRCLGWVAVLAFFAVGSSLPLNDGKEIAKFPFTNLVQRFIYVLCGEPFVVIPKD